MTAPFSVIVEVRGGVVQNVDSSSDDIQIVIVDWDDIDAAGCLGEELHRELFDAAGNLDSAQDILRKVPMQPSLF
jgi:hypothetical protein